MKLSTRKYKEIIKFKKLKNRLEVVHQADLPAQSGLGASSSFSVGLINCIEALNGSLISKKFSKSINTC